MSDEPREVNRRARDLEAEFRELAQKLDVPARPDYATRVRERLESGSGATRPTLWRPPFGFTGPLGRLATATIVLVLAMVIVLSVPATRAAVADLFGFAGVNVRTAPSAAPSPRNTVDTALDLGEPVTIDEARQRVSFPVSLPVVPGLDAPDVYVTDEPGLESVSLVYGPTTGFPATAATHVGLLVGEYAGTATPYFDKLIEAGEPVTQVTVDGRWPGIYFTDPHQILVRGPDGLVHEDRPRLAAPTLVWVREGVTYRLEGALDMTNALAVAASMH
ncbi:MAG TPA: hypothetical protein VFH23_14190 [Jiangellaceae bacterium]|nr:hypothetical protein [Jiangellaceae bacterium]